MLLFPSSPAPANRARVVTILTAVLSLFAAGCSREKPAAASTPPPPRPNIIFVLVDDLGWGDVGVFFQNARAAKNDPTIPAHRTPNIDRLGLEGIQIPQHYCPASVCAPSRASLLLGVHQGHANVRDNQFDKALEDNHTVASVMRRAGYATAAFGKWGLQGKNPPPDAPNGFPGHPMNRGFDYYFGYMAHRDGHQHYPKEDGKPLYDGAREVSQQYDLCYTTDLFTARAKKWIADHEASTPEQPFFIYLAYDTPHAALTLPPCPFPEEGLQWIGEPGRMINTATGERDSYLYPEYASGTWDDDGDPATPEVPWPNVQKRYASLVRRIDDCVGDLLRFLEQRGLDDNTLIVFTTDNGPSKESYLPEEYTPTFFDAFGPMDGIKRDLWEGGIRVGALARWPAGIPSGQTSHTPSAFWDWMPTFAQLAGVPAPARTDGVSLVPTLSGHAGKQQPSRIYIEYKNGQRTPDYEEFEPYRRGHIRQQMQAIRLGDYMGVRYNIEDPDQAFEIYNVVADPKETTNLAGQPDFASLQKEMHDTVRRVRRPDAEAPRPYDDELVPALANVDRGALQRGVEWRAFSVESPWVPKLDSLTPSSTGTAPRPSPRAPGPAEADATDFLFTGYLDIPASASYTLHLPEGTPALLRVHEAIVIDNDRGGQISGTVRLEAGLHPFRLYVKRTDGTPGDFDLRLSPAETPLATTPAVVLRSAR